MRLVTEQQVVVGPELALGSGRFCRFSRQFGIGMNLALRVVAVNKTQLAAKMRKHDFHRRLRLGAGRAFKVAVFHQCDAGRLGTQNVVNGLVGLEHRIRSCMGTHGNHL